MKITKMRLKLLMMIVLITDNGNNDALLHEKMNKLDENVKVFWEGQIWTSSSF